MKRRKEIGGYILEISLSLNLSHPDKFKLCIYCRNKKTNRYLWSDNSHDARSGKYPFHVHNSITKGRDYNIVLGSDKLPIGNYINKFLKSIKEAELIEKEEDIEILNSAIILVLNDIINDLKEELDLES